MSAAILDAFAFKWETGEGRVIGSGLGSEPGTVRLIVFALERKKEIAGFGEVVRRWPGPSLEMRPPAVTEWGDDLIKFVAPASFLGEIDDFKASTAEQFRLVNPTGTLFNIYDFTCEVRTKAGDVLTYPETEPRKRKS